MSFFMTLTFLGKKSLKLWRKRTLLQWQTRYQSKKVWKLNIRFLFNVNKNGRKKWTFNFSDEVSKIEWTLLIISTSFECIGDLFRTFDFAFHGLLHLQCIYFYNDTLNGSHTVLGFVYCYIIVRLWRIFRVCIF